MQNVEKKKSFELNILGLVSLKSEGRSTAEVVMMLCLQMGFVIALVLLLKVYALPAISILSLKQLLVLAIKEALGRVL
jgi:hypothetical protein